MIFMQGGYYAKTKTKNLLVKATSCEGTASALTTTFFLFVKLRYPPCRENQCEEGDKY